MSFGFTGGTVVGFRKFVEDDLTVILLTNGYRYRFDHNGMINRMAGMVNEDLIDQITLINEDIYHNFASKKKRAALKAFKRIKRNNPSLNFENISLHPFFGFRVPSFPFCFTFTDDVKNIRY